MGNNVIKTCEDIVVKNINCGEYKKKADALKLIKYITGNSAALEKQKTVRYIGAYGVPYGNPKLCRDAMYIVKKYYDKMDKMYKTGKELRSVYHFTISFPSFVNDANIIKFIAIDICKSFYEKGFQNIYAVHEDKDNLHIHIVVNITSFMTGKQMHLSDSELETIPEALKEIANNILKDNGY